MKLLIEICDESFDETNYEAFIDWLNTEICAGNMGCGTNVELKAHIVPDNLHSTEYKLYGTDHNILYSIKTSRYLVQNNTYSLSRKGKFTPTPMPSNRPEGWYIEHTFNTLEEALQHIYKYEKKKVNTS